jgi:LTXXQ motif family protein
MRSLTRITGSLLFLAAAAGTAGAQRPAGPPPGAPAPGGAPMRAGPIGDPAQFLLAHTGELQLTDQQVVRLAAIARRTQARRTSLRARVDSLRTARPAPGVPAPNDSARGRMRRMAPPPEVVEQLRTQQRQIVEQQRTDLRDAITVLTPDQQATAWMMVSARGGPGMGRMGGMGGMSGPRGRGGMGGRGVAPRRGGFGPGEGRGGPPGRRRSGEAAETAPQPTPAR